MLMNYRVYLSFPQLFSECWFIFLEIYDYISGNFFRACFINLSKIFCALWVSFSGQIRKANAIKGLLSYECRQNECYFFIICHSS